MFAIAIIAGYEFLLLALLFLPSGSEFAREFRTSCFGYDPGSGTVAGIVVFTTLTVPLIVLLLVSISWWHDLCSAVQTRRPAAIGYLGVGFALAFGVGVALTSAGSTPATGELPFPADALRTDFPSPEFKLKDQTGRMVQLADLRGQVVLVTSIFSKCSYSCPIILRDVRDAVAALSPEQRDDLRVAVITLDPQNDTPEVLAKFASSRGITSPPFHLLSGAPANVERTLDDLAVPRTRNRDTGLIDHANLFILLNRKGRIAYRFTVDERRQHWLGCALQELLDEEADG